MADQELKFTLVVDSKTGAVKDVQREFTTLENQVGQKVPAAAKQAAASMDSIGNVVKGLGLARILGGAADAAFKSSQSIQELKDQLDITADALVDSLEPAIRPITQGLQGVLVLVQGLIPAIQTLINSGIKSLTQAFDAMAEGVAGIINLMSGNFSAAKENFKSGVDDINQIWKGSLDALGRATEQAADAIIESGDRVTGRTKVTLEVQLQQALETTRLLVTDAKLSAAEKLKIIDEGEKKANDLLRETTKFKTATGEEQKLLLLKQANEFAGLRKRAEKEELGDAEALAQAKMAAAQTALQQQFDARMQLEASTEAQRLSIVTERQAAELALVQEAVAAKQLTQEQAEIATVQIVSKGAADRARISLQEATQTVQQRRALFQSLITSGAQAAAQEFAQSRDAGRAVRAAGAEQIRTLASQASTQIAVSGAVAAAKSFANAGGFPLGIPAAVATIAFYTGLAAVVSAAGGAVANAVAPPAAGGGAAAAGAGDLGGGAAPAGGGFDASAAPGGGPPVAAARRDTIVFNIQTLDGTIPTETLRNIDELLNRRSRS